jgi:hypothetical protein
MLTAKECRRFATEMSVRAAKSPVTREQFLQMAAAWTQLEYESAKAEGLLNPGSLYPGHQP